MMRRGFKGAVSLLRTCANAKPGEQVLIVTDSATDPGIASAIMAAASQLRIEANVVTMKPRALPGDEPPPAIVAAMGCADVIICPTSRTLYHTNARTDACKRGARFISMAGATMPVLASDAMLTNFPRREKVLNHLVKRLTRAKHIQVTNPAGTNLSFDVRGRQGHGVSGMARRPGDGTGTPDIEAYIAPVEQETNGILVVDGSTSVTGVIQQPMKITIKNGFALSVVGGTDASQLRRMLRKTGSHASYRVAEFGIGLNPLAHIRGAIIEDEGKLGTAHVALGDNTRLGGRNSAPVHIDLVIKNPVVQLDGEVVLNRKQLTL